MLNSATLPGAVGRQRLAEAPSDRTTLDVGATQGWPERLFLGFGFLVLQGAFVGLASSAAAEDAAAADGSDLPHMLAFALLLLGTAVFARKHLGEILRGAGANLAFFILPAILIASVAWSVEPSLTLKRSILALAVCGFDLYVAATVGLDRVLKLLSITIFIAALASAVAALALPSLGRELNDGLIGDWRGVFPQKNTLGQVMSVGVFIELGLIIRARRILVGAVARVMLLMLVLAMAHSASSILSALLAIVLSAFYLSFRQGAVGIVLCALVTVAGLVILGSVAGADLPLVFNLLDRDASLTGRTDLWIYVEKAIHERPLLGWGYLAFWTPDSTHVTYIQNQIHWPAPNAHNGYLEMALGLGYLGLAGLAVTGAWALRRIAVLVARHDDLGAMLWIISIQLLAANLTESFMINASVFVWNLFALLGFKAGIVLRQQSVPAPEPIQPVSILDRAKPRPAA